MKLYQHMFENQFMRNSKLVVYAEPISFRRVGDRFELDLRAEVSLDPINDNTIEVTFSAYSQPLKAEVKKSDLPSAVPFMYNDSVSYLFVRVDLI